MTRRNLTEAEGTIINKVVKRKVNQVLKENYKQWNVTSVKGKLKGTHWKAYELESYLMARATARAINYVNRPKDEQHTKLENWLNKGLEWLVQDFYKHMQKQDVLNLSEGDNKRGYKSTSMDKTLEKDKQGRKRTLHDVQGSQTIPNTDKVANDNSIVTFVDEILMLLEDKVSVNKYEKYTIVLEGIAFADKYTKKGDELVRTGTVKDNGTIHLEGLGEEIGMHPATITRLLKEIGKHLINDKETLKKFAKSVRF